MKGLVLPLLLLTVTLSLQAQSTVAPGLATLPETRQLTDRAMNLFRQEKFADAYELLKPHWPLPAVEIEALANQMNTQWPVVRQRYGAAVGTEFIHERKVGGSFVQYTYLHKFERHAIRWVFVFYKPADRWLVNAVSFDDGISQMFE
jgi:hypothetical protein